VKKWGCLISKGIPNFNQMLRAFNDAKTDVHGLVWKSRNQDGKTCAYQGEPPAWVVRVEDSALPADTRRGTSKISSWIVGTTLQLRQTLGARVPGFQWEHAEYIAGIETLCPTFSQQEHPVYIWNVIWVCVPNVPIGNISFTAGMRPCHVSEMYPPRTFQMLSTHVLKMFPAYAQVDMLWVHQLF
jgi:hypothetical protein